MMMTYARGFLQRNPVGGEPAQKDQAPDHVTVKE
jgi:hypothetical protein